MAATDNLARAHFEESRAAVRRVFLRELRPTRRLTVSEWADKHRWLSKKESAQPGHWRTSRTPYLREIMDSLSPFDPAAIIVLQKGAQLGATEAANNWLGYIIDHEPGPVLYVQPTIELGNRISKTRIASMIASSPTVAGKVREPRSRDSSNTITMKEFDDGLLMITGANSAAGLSQSSVRFLFCDETDRYPADVDGEGDPLDLAMGRTRAFERNRKVYLASTPTVKGVSNIERWHKLGDKRVYEVPCPGCGCFQPITWRRIEWDRRCAECGHEAPGAAFREPTRPDDSERHQCPACQSQHPFGDDGGHLPETARMVCSECEARIPESAKEQMLPAGVWRPTATPRDRRVRSYHLSALYSPLGLYSWSSAVADFLKAKREGAAALKVWTNLTLGETWEERGEEIKHTVLYSRRIQYPTVAGKPLGGLLVPRDAVLITFGADVQKDRIEVGFDGWTVDEQCYALAYSVLYGDVEQNDPWEQLDVQLSRTFLHESGAQLAVAGGCIDAGFKTSQVMDFVKARQARRFWAVMGKDGPGRPLVSAPSAKRTGRNRRPVPLFTVGVDQVKALLYSRLRLTDPAAPGYCHFPISADFDEEYFAQLVAESVVTRYAKGRPYLAWVKNRPRNEALDCRVYSMAAITLLGQTALRAAARRLRPKPGPEGEPEPRPGRRRRRNWATDWRR